MNLPKRAGALILVALFVAAGVWLNSATPSAAPAPPVPVERAGPQPTLAPLPLGPAAPAAPAGATATEAEISYEIAPLSPPIIVAPPHKTPAPPAAKPAEKPQANCQPSDCQYYYRRGWFRRR